MGDKAVVSTVFTGSAVSTNPALAGELIEIYRASYVKRLRARFQEMLSEAYAIYVTALDEGFEPPLKAHLADVLQDMIVRAPTLAEAFEGELMKPFQAFLGGLESGEANPGGEGYGPGEDAQVGEFVSRTVRTLDTQHGSVILAITRIYMKRMGGGIEGSRPPWGPTYLFAAFAEVIRLIEIPIHGQVKLALYKAFAQEVLRHVGNIYLTFRDALPAEVPSPSRGMAQATFSGATVGDSCPVNKSLEVVGLSATPVSPMKRRLIFPGVILVGLIVAVGGIWWSATDIAVPGRPSGARRDEKPSPNVGTDSPAPTHPSERGSAEAGPIQPGMQEQKQSVSLTPVVSEAPMASPPSDPPIAETAPASTPPLPVVAQPMSQGVEPEASPEPPPLDERGKREVLRGIKLKSFKWKVDPRESGILSDLRIENTGQSRVGGIEVVCAQYSRRNAFLEAAKKILADPIEAGQGRDYPATLIGYASQNTYRISCVIADAMVLPNP